MRKITMKKAIELVFLMIIYGLGVFAGTQLHKIGKAPFCVKEGNITAVFTSKEITQGEILTPIELSGIILRRLDSLETSREAYKDMIVTCPK